MLTVATLLWLGLLLYALLDVVLADGAEQRVLPKPVWVLAVLLVPIVGPVAWLVLGRPPRAGRPVSGPTTPGSAPDGTDPRRDHPAGGPVPGDRPRPRGRESRGGARRGPGRAPKGPDDDPEFLRELDERLRRRSDDS